MALQAVTLVRGARRECPKRRRVVSQRSCSGVSALSRPEPQRRWGDEVGGDDHAPVFPSQCSPRHSLMTSTRVCRDGARRLGSNEMDDRDCRISMSRTSRGHRIEGRPCVLRAIDHRSRRCGERMCSAGRLGRSHHRAELRHADALVDAASSTFEGSTPEILSGGGGACANRVGCALMISETHCLLQRSGPDRSGSLAHSGVCRGSGMGARGSKLIFASKLCVAATRTFASASARWLHARADATAIGACECLS